MALHLADNIRKRTNSLMPFVKMVFYIIFCLQKYQQYMIKYVEHTYLLKGFYL